jgi:hypothetical protein
MTRPRISFDPIKLFDLHVADPGAPRSTLRSQAARLGAEGTARRLFIGLPGAPDVARYRDFSPDHASAPSS